MLAVPSTSRLPIVSILPVDVDTENAFAVVFAATDIPPFAFIVPLAPILLLFTLTPFAAIDLVVI
jgi:hypothetical protein